MISINQVPLIFMLFLFEVLVSFLCLLVYRIDYKYIFLFSILCFFMGFDGWSLCWYYIWFAPLSGSFLSNSFSLGFVWCALLFCSSFRYRSWFAFLPFFLSFYLIFLIFVLFLLIFLFVNFGLDTFGSGWDGQLWTTFWSKRGLPWISEFILNNGRK